MQTEGSTLLADLEPDWRTSYLDCLTQGQLPSDKIEAQQIARWAKTFVTYGDDKELYRRSPRGILQRCITNEEGNSTLSLFCLEHRCRLHTMEHVLAPTRPSMAGSHELPMNSTAALPSPPMSPYRCSTGSPVSCT
jgi:hypothetical protein